jgi:hypothetical protein
MARHEHIADQIGMIDKKRRDFSDPKGGNVAEFRKSGQKSGRVFAKRAKMSAEQIGLDGRRRNLFGWFHRLILTQRGKGAKTQRFIKK